MPYLSTAEAMYKITGPDGTALWQGAAIASEIFLVTNKEASATITAGEAVRVDAASLVLGHFGMLGTASSPNVVFGGLRVSAASNINWLGVASEPILAGKTGRVLGRGSICGVQSVAAPTSNVVGSSVEGSATAGKVDTRAANAANAVAAFPAGGTQLGRVLQISGTTGPPTDMGTAGVLGIIIAQT